MRVYISRYTYPTDEMQPCDEAFRDENGCWYIELPTMPREFIELWVKYQTLILNYDITKDEFKIEIFDDWSEQA